MPAMRARTTEEMTEEIKFRAPEGTRANLKRVARIESRALQKKSQSDIIREAIDERIARVEAKQKAAA